MAPSSNGCKLISRTKNHHWQVHHQHAMTKEWMYNAKGQRHQWHCPKQINQQDKWVATVTKNLIQIDLWLLWCMVCRHGFWNFGIWSLRQTQVFVLPSPSPCIHHTDTQGVRDRTVPSGASTAIAFPAVQAQYLMDGLCWLWEGWFIHITLGKTGSNMWCEGCNRAHQTMNLKWMRIWELCSQVLARILANKTPYSESSSWQLIKLPKLSSQLR